MTGTASPRPAVLAAVSLLSGSTLAYEVLLMRLFAVIQWHHFAYMMISVALLGYGASGTLLGLAGARATARFERLFPLACAGFGVLAPSAFLLAQRVAFNPLEFLWDPGQWPALALIYLLLLLPFLFAAGAVCLALASFPASAHRTYAWDLAGAGAGSLGVILVLYLVEPQRALALVASLALLAAALATRRGRSFLLLAAALPLVLPASWLALHPSPYKELSQTLQVSGARVLAERSGPLGTVTAVESTRIPFRYAPGMSLAAPAGPPPQLALFTDGDGFSALNRFDGDPGALAYTGWLSSALPYHLLQRPRVLVLGAGAGSDVLQALALGAGEVDAVELNPAVTELVQGPFAEFSGRPYTLPNVHLHIAEARGFVAANPQRWDLIQVALLDAFGAASAGLHALSENYLYTVEAMQAYLHRLSPGGMLAVTRWLSLPPRDTLKLFATAVEALEREGVREPGTQLALIRSWKTTTLLVKNGAFTADEIARLQAFCTSRSFDTAWFPGMRAEQANRYNLLERPWFFEAVQALLGPERQRFIERYKFHIAPATDDRPYFFRSFTWSALPEIYGLKEQGGLPLLEWGYPVLVATLAQALPLALAIVLLPLAARRGTLAALPDKARTAGYFLAIGLGFMFVEMAYIQRFTLFLSHPLYAAAVVLTGFLVFAGLGSRLSKRVAVRAGKRAPLLAAGAVALLALAWLLLLPLIFPPLLGLPEWVRIPVALALIAPLALVMGMPFPLGLREASGRAQGLVTWAWAVNGCASVVGAVLATLLAVHFGFSAVVTLAALLYLAAPLAWRAPARA